MFGGVVMWIQLSHNDLDGIGCIILGRYAQQKSAHPVSYNANSKYSFENITNRLFSDKELVNKLSGVLVTDINLTEELYNSLRTKIREDTRVVLFDHHKNSLRHVDNGSNTTLHVDESICATQLMFNSIRDKVDVDKYSSVVNAINAFDVWELDSSSYAVDLQRTYHWEVFMNPDKKYVKFPNKVLAYTDLIYNDPPTETYKPKWYEHALAQYNKVAEPLVENAMSNVFVKDGIHIFSFAQYDNTPTFEVGLRTQRNGVNDIVYIFNEPSRFVLSVRTGSENGIDLSNLATKFDGGGGHESAASFSVANSETDLKNALETVFQYYKEAKT